MWTFLLFWLVSVVLFVLGASVGSFLNVLVYRSARAQDWVKSRSKCDHCGKKLHWFENIPLLSYLMLDGKSGCCHKKLDLTHPVVEILTGSLFVWWFWGGTLFFKLVQSPLDTLQPLFWLLVGIMLLGILVADVLHMIIPDVLVAGLIIISLFYRVVLVMMGSMRSQDFGLMILSTLVLGGFFYLLWWLTKGRGFGFGDVKFSIAMGLLLGWPRVLIGVFLAFILGSLVGIFLISLKKKKFGQKVPFGPFLVIGTVLALLVGFDVWHWYLGMLGI